MPSDRVTGWRLLTRSRRCVSQPNANSSFESSRPSQRTIIHWNHKANQFRLGRLNAIVAHACITGVFTWVRFNMCFGEEQRIGGGVG